MIISQSQPPQPQLRVMPPPSLGAHPTVGGNGLSIAHRTSRQPSQKARQRVNEQQDRQSRAAASETEIKRASITNTFQIAETLLNLHAFFIAPDHIPDAEVLLRQGSR